MRRSLILSLVWFASSPLAAQSPEPIDEAANTILRKQGLEASQVMQHLSWICDVYGPRLTGSPNLARAQEWAMGAFRGFGLSNVHLEDWGPFGSGWELERCAVHVVGDNPWPVLAWPKAWSPSLAGRVEADAVLVAGMSAEDLDALDLTGKVVLVDTPREIGEPLEAESKRLNAEELLDLATGTQSAGPGARFRNDSPRFREYQLRRAAQQKVFEKHPLAIVDRASKGDYGTVFVQGADMPSASGESRSQRARPWDAGAVVVPQFTLAAEHYNRICRLLEKKLAVRLALELETRTTLGDGMQHNVIAELPGTDPQIGDEVVMLGAHFDSWHAGTGATDNGTGSAAMVEAMRLLTELVHERGQGPRRTIRVALWSGEEQGLLGSRAYVAAHFAAGGGWGRAPIEVKPEHSKLAAYFNLDNGTGRIRGVYLEHNEAVAPIFRAWLEPFRDLDARTLTLSDTGGTDHQSFDGLGLPGFQFIQDPMTYGARTHHSNMDCWDHAVEKDLQQASTIIASFAWHAAQRQDKLPRKPLPAPEPAEAGTERTTTSGQ